MTDQLPPVEYTVAFDDDSAKHQWQVVAIEVDERLNLGSQLTVELASQELHIDLASFVGQTLEVTMQRGDGPAHFLYGVVCRAVSRGKVGHHGVALFHCRSAFELAQQNQNSRIWQDVSPADIVAEVLEEILGPYGRTFSTDSTTRGQFPREYCVQYQESDYDFVCRLLAEEGISFFIRHDPDAGHDVVTLVDDNANYRVASNFDGSSSFPLTGANIDLASSESLGSLEWSCQLTTNAVLRRDYDWRTPKNLLTSTVDGVDSHGRTRRVYTHLGRRFVADDLAERARDSHQAVALDGALAHCRTNALSLHPGARFGADLESVHEAGSEYIVFGSKFRGSDPRPLGDDAADVVGEVLFEREIECVPAELPIRPKPKATRRMGGPQTATVVGDGEIYTDEHGRVQVQFHWAEVATFEKGASCWVRCAQSWAGSGWGAQFIPRVGMEVVVEFLDGNPDRPLITGCVYNGDNAAPFALPGSSTQSGWRSNSSPGGDGHNEFRFEDAAGNEEVYLHGQKNLRIRVGNSASETVGNNSNISVGHDRDKSVGNDESEKITGNKTISVGADRMESVGGSVKLSIGNLQTVAVGSHQTVVIGSGRAVSIASSDVETVGDTKTTTVTKTMNTIVGGGANHSVGGAMLEEVGDTKTVTVGSTSSETVVGNRMVQAKNIAQAAKKRLKLDAGSKLSAYAGEKLTLTSDGTFEAKVEKDGVLEFGDKLVIQCGASTITLENGKITFSAVDIELQASGMLIMKGTQIMEN